MLKRAPDLLTDWKVIWNEKLRDVKIFYNKA